MPSLLQTNFQPPFGAPEIGALPCGAPRSSCPTEDLRRAEVVAPYEENEMVRGRMWASAPTKKIRKQSRREEFRRNSSLLLFPDRFRLLCRATMER